MFLRRLKILKTLPIQVKLDIIISNSVWFKVHGTCSTHNCNKWLWLPYLLISTYASCSQVFLSLPYKYRLTHLLNKNNNHNISMANSTKQPKIHTMQTYNHPFDYEKSHTIFMIFWYSFVKYNLYIKCNQFMLMVSYSTCMYLGNIDCIQLYLEEKTLVVLCCLFWFSIALHSYPLTRKHNNYHTLLQNKIIIVSPFYQ